jgi:hypothetical protein
MLLRLPFPSKPKRRPWIRLIFPLKVEIRNLSPALILDDISKNLQAAPPVDPKTDPDRVQQWIQAAEEEIQQR